MNDFKVFYDDEDILFLGKEGEEAEVVEISPGEHIEQMQGKVRIICNSQLQADDVRYIKDQPQNMKLEWCEGRPEEELTNIPERLKCWYRHEKRLQSTFACTTTGLLTNIKSMTRKLWRLDK